MATPELLAGEGTPETASETLFVEPASWRRLGHELLHSKKGLAGAIIVAIVIFVAVAAPVITPHSPSAQDFLSANKGPTWNHPFGSDDLGRDVLTRTFYGTRVSLGLALLVVTIAATIGTLLGAAAGFLGGAAESLIMRITDLMLVFPWLLFALLLITIMGAGFKSLLVALSALLWLSYARVVRAETLKLRELEFIHASRTVGASKPRILFRHVLPNVMHTVIVLATLDISVVIILEAGLTYLGLGLQPPTPTWGGMISDGQAFLDQSPQIMLAPGAALVLTVVGVNLLGDWLRDHFDPSLRVQ